MRLNYQVQGHGRPLVILHGFLGSSDNWRSMSKRLSSHFTVYCLDLRNHGQSPHSDAMDYPIMAADLREFVEEQWQVIVQSGVDNPETSGALARIFEHKLSPARHELRPITDEEQGEGFE